MPDLFFILDSRAQAAMNKIVSGRSPKTYPKEKKHYASYANYFYKSLFLQNKIREEFSITLTPRQIDNYLLVIANEDLRRKNKKKNSNKKKV